MLLSGLMFGILTVPQPEDGGDHQAHALIRHTRCGTGSFDRDCLVNRPMPDSSVGPLYIQTRVNGNVLSELAGHTGCNGKENGGGA